jgi:regulation of enolase protein 1 (concanavalin A-like superfamily)
LWLLAIASATMLTDVPVAAQQSLLPSVAPRWSGIDVGHATPAGSASVTGDVLTMAGGGMGIGGTADQFYFLQYAVNGDAQVIVHVNSFLPANPSSEVGVMIRSSLKPGAASAATLLTGSGVAFERRRRAGTTSYATQGVSTPRAPIWLRIDRNGNRVASYTSPDGSTWTLLGSETRMMWDQTIYVGLAVSSNDPTQLATADLSNILVSGIPVPLQNTDVGSPWARGGARYIPDTFTVAGGGTDIGGTRDQFHYVYEPIVGDVEIVARVRSMVNVDPWSKAGVMIRETLSGGSRHVSALVTPGNGYVFNRRAVAGEMGQQSPGGAGAAPGWLRVVRLGTRFEAFRSVDGLVWTSIGFEDIPMSPSVFVGLVVSSHNSRSLETATFDSVQIGPPASEGNRMPVVSLESPGMNETFVAPADIAVAASASDPEGRLSRVDFFADATLIGTATSSPYSVRWSSVPRGSYSLTAVARDADGATSTSAPVPITVTDPNQPPTVALTAPASGSTFIAGTNITLSANASDPEGRLDRVDFFSGATLVGSDASSPFSVVWSSVPAGSYTLTAVALDRDGGSATSAPVSITVNANQLPTVSITAPTSGATFNFGINLTIAATASDPENRLERVDFFSGATLLGTDLTSPFSIVWNSVPAGSYTLTAVAVDRDGGQRTSAPVSITVRPNQVPAVSLTSPSPGSTFTSGANITMSANASDPEGRLERVDFFGGATLVGTDLSSPYSVVWSSVPAGAYTLTAVAVDRDGGQATSAPVSITVNPPNQPPTVSITAPLPGATFVAGATITVAASASDPEGRMGRVDFYSGTTLLASDTTAPYSVAWGAVPAGSFVLTAVAVDLDGGQTTSAPVSITVTPSSSSWVVVFTASVDHDTTVTSYRLEVFANGADPNTATPVATSDLGKPTPDASNEISVDRTAFFTALAPGTYLATVSAIGTGGSSRSAAVSFTR